MKKLALSIGIILMILSCGTSKTVRDSKKVIKGEWTLSSITYSTAGKYNVTLLNDTSKDCFEGSTWQFIPNNNTGTYTINETSCSTGPRNFVFTIQEVNNHSQCSPDQKCVPCMNAHLGHKEDVEQHTKRRNDIDHRSSVRAIQAWLCLT